MSFLPSSFVRRIRLAAAAALFGSATSVALAEEVPWLVLQVKGDEGAVSQEVFDTYLLEGEGTSPIPGAVNPGCLPAQLCPPIEMPPGTPPVPTEPTPMVPQPSQVPQTTVPMQPLTNFNQAFDSSTLLASRDVPVMLGDFFGSGPAVMTLSGFSIPNNFIPNPAAGGQYGRIKLAENVSPIPTDRIYLNYSFFKSVPLITGGLDINRLTMGFEKTFFNGNLSFEARVPFAGTLGNTLYINPAGDLNVESTGTSEWQVGNVQLYVKALLLKHRWGAISAGLGIGLPTAPDLLVVDSNGNLLLQTRNRSVHLQPFVGAVFTPTDRLYTTSVLQFDFDTTGQTVLSNEDGSGLMKIGQLQDNNFLYFSHGIGYWLVHTNDPSAILQRLSPVLEVHVNQTISDSDTVAAVSGQGISQTSNNVTVVNGVVGISALLRNNLKLTAGYVVPLGQSGRPRQFDGEFRFLVNWYYGRVTPIQQAGIF